MAGRQSAAMDRVEKMVKAKKYRPAEAARRNGVTATAVYVSAWYKVWKAEQKKLAAEAAKKGE